MVGRFGAETVGVGAGERKHERMDRPCCARESGGSGGVSRGTSSGELPQ